MNEYRTPWVRSGTAWEVTAPPTRATRPLSGLLLKRSSWPTGRDAHGASPGLHNSVWPVGAKPLSSSQLARSTVPWGTTFRPWTRVSTESHDKQPTLQQGPSATPLALMVAICPAAAASNGLPPR